MKQKQDWRLFLIFAILVALLLIFLTVNAVMAGIENGFSNDTIGLLILGTVLTLIAIAGVFWGVSTFCNLNAGKRDASMNVQFLMSVGGQEQPLTDIEVLRNEMLSNPNGEDIIITLSPEYYGLASWTIVRSNGWYINFVIMHKGDKFVTYFICPFSNIDVAINDFRNVFVNKEAVDTSVLSNMRHYKGSLEVFHLDKIEKFLEHGTSR